MAIKAEVRVDGFDRTVVTLIKSRGNLTMDEIQKYLQKNMPGAYIILLNARADDYEDWPDMTGDVQDLYLYDGDCPVCRKELPAWYCPKCGADLTGEYVKQLAEVIETKSDWKVTYNDDVSDTPWSVYRLLNKKEVDYPGNRECFPVNFETRAEAEETTKRLNNQSVGR